MHQTHTKLLACALALGFVVTSTLAVSSEPVADAAVVSDPCSPDRLTILGADGRSVRDRPETVVQVFPTGDICEFEQRILESIASDRGTTLTDEVRAEILSYGRNVVRARMFAELFSMASGARPPLDDVETGALDWFVDRFRELRVESATNARAEYEKWSVEQCDYEAPEGFTYFAPDALCTGLAAIFSGGPNPPTYRDFREYGASITSEGLLDETGDAALSETARFLTVGGILVAANVAAISLAASLVTVLQAVVFPFARGVVSIGRFAGPAGILITTVITAVLRGIDVVRGALVPGRLANDVEEASSVDFGDVLAATSAPGGSAELLLAFMNGTTPDYPDPDPIAVPSDTPGIDTPRWILPDGSSTPSFTYLDQDGLRRAWVKDRWFVVQPIEPAGPIRMEPVLSYISSEGLPTTATFVGRELVVESIVGFDAGEEPACNAPTCRVTTRIDHLVDGDDGPEPSSATFAGQIPEIVSGPTVTGDLEAGGIVTLDVVAIDAETETLDYEWLVSSDGFSGGDTATQRYTGQTVMHRFAGPGLHTITVRATDESGAEAVASTQVTAAIVPTELTARTQSRPTGTFVDRPIDEGQSGRLVVDSTIPAVCISVDWDGDGVMDDQKYSVSGTDVIFPTPTEGEFEVLEAGVVAVTLVAEAAECGGEEIGGAVVPVVVRNSRPFDLVAEIFVDGEWRVLSSTFAETVPSFDEGSFVPVRVSARDTRFDALTFDLLWRPGGTPTTRVKSVSAPAPIVTNRTVVETTIELVDQRAFNGLLTSLLVVVGDGERNSSEQSRSYFNIVNVAPTIEQTYVDSDNAGNVTFDVRVADAGSAQRDIERISIDWGDGSDPEDVPFDPFLGSRVFASNVVGHGQHRYATPGPHTVTVTAFDDVTSVSEQFEITLAPFQPVITDITELDVGAEGSLTTLGIEVEDPDTAPEDLSVVVDWGDGSTSPAEYEPVSGSFVATRTYVEPATYAVVIEASDGELEAVPFDGEVTVADIPASVVIDQSSTQADPTSRDMVAFDVVFSEPVTGFGADDVSLSGTAEATTATVVDSGDGTVYRVNVTGMARAGTVVADVVESAAINGDGSPSLASTSTDNEVTFIPRIEIFLPGLDGVLAVDNDAGQAGATVDFAVTATGGSAPPEVTCAPASGSFFPLGDTTVRCTADDGGPEVDEFAPTSSLTATSDFVVRVVDVDPPTLATDPAIDGGVTATSADGRPVVVTFPVPTAADNSGPVAVACSPASGTLFPVGSTTVTCTVSDASGNVASTSFVVTVDDRTTAAGSATTMPETPPPNPNDSSGEGAPVGPVFDLPATGTGLHGIVLLALATLLMGAFLALARRTQIG